jgi:hypothetical protein
VKTAEAHWERKDGEHQIIVYCPHCHRPDQGGAYLAAHVDKINSTGDWTFTCPKDAQHDGCGKKSHLKFVPEPPVAARKAARTRRRVSKSV